mgnify:CR=1 FL=1
MTLIEKTLKEFDEFYHREKGSSLYRFCRLDFPESDSRSIKAFITQALQEQDRESRRDIFNKVEQLEYTLDTPQIDFKLKVLNILKQDETKGSN